MYPRTGSVDLRCGGARSFEQRSHGALGLADVFVQELRPFHGYEVRTGLARDRFGNQRLAWETRARARVPITCRLAHTGKQNLRARYLAAAWRTVEQNARRQRQTERLQTAESAA